MLTAERLKEVLFYNDATGKLTWKIRTGRRCVVGAVAGSRDRRGYIEISIDGERIYAHRAVFAIKNGYLPPEDTDHKDTIKFINKDCNLRQATRSQNMGNTHKYKNNTSGYKGVTWCKAMGAWQAQICCNGVRKYLGCYDTKEEAAAVYAKNAHELFRDFARTT